jgi:membrane protease YdiL (CAAX protease family)
MKEDCRPECEPQVQDGAAGNTRSGVPTARSIRLQARFAGAYFVVLLGYLFLHQEGEWLHWVSLVAVPLVGLAIVARQRSIRALTRSIGLTGSTRGIGWVAVLGGAFQVLQLLNDRQRAELSDALGSPLGFLLPVAAFLLLIATAATTEEVFFRGILQTRLADRLNSEPLGLALAAAAFALYHLPYAYLHPSWPSFGRFSEACLTAAANGAITGLALGFVFWRSRRNLAAAVCLHALIDLVPATKLVHRLFTTGA